MNLRHFGLLLLVATLGLMVPVALANAPDPAWIPAAAPTPTPSLASTGLELAANQPLQITLSGAPLDLIYDSVRGETVTISARSLTPALGLDTTLELLDENGVRLGFNDDVVGVRSGFNLLDSVIPSIHLLEDGIVIVRVSSIDPAINGPVEVLVSTEEGGTPITGNGPVSDSIVTTVQDNVPDNDEDCTTVSLIAGETITAVAHALDEALDTTLTLLGPDGSQLAYNDDHSLKDTSLFRFNSAVENVAVPADGDYQFCVSGFGGSSGPYELTITRASGSAITSPTPANGSLGADQVITDRVPENEQFVITQAWQAGDVYTLTARALDADFDPQMGIFPERSDTLLAGNDDHGTSSTDLAFFNSQITNFIVPESGSYDVVVGGYQGGGGPFELTIARTGQNAPLGAPEVETISGTLTPNGIYTHETVLPAGAYVTITVAAGEDGALDPLVTLITPDGVIAADNDDHTSGYPGLGPGDSLIRNYLVTRAGEHTIEVRGYQGSSGPFTLTIATLQ